MGRYSNGTSREGERGARSFFDSYVCRFETACFLVLVAFPSIAPSVSKTFRISTDPTPFECPTSASAQLEKIGSPFVFVLRCKDSTVHSLESINTMNADEYFVGCQDLSANESHPGWIVRNLLVMLSVRYELRVTNLLCYRSHSNKSLLFRNVSIPVASDLSSFFLRRLTRTCGRMGT